MQIGKKIVKNNIFDYPKYIYIYYINIIINFFIRNSEKADNVNSEVDFDVEDEKVQLYSKCLIKKFNSVSINNKVI